MIKDIKDLAGKAVHCEAFENAVTLLTMLNDLGITWSSSKIINPQDTHWLEYRENTDYLIDKNCKTIQYGKISYCTERNITVVKFKDLDIVEIIKEIYIPGTPTLQSNEREKILRAMLNTSEEKNKN